jgi:hypothetical protein
MANELKREKVETLLAFYNSMPAGIMSFNIFEKMCD